MKTVVYKEIIIHHFDIEDLPDDASEDETTERFTEMMSNSEFDFSDGYVTESEIVDIR